jgi:DNA-binding LacI/PurR family transcriptional regulator
VAAGGVKHKPVYRRIYSELSSELEAGLYNETGMLPSEKELCARFGVERNTIRKSLQLLVNEKRIVRRPGLGTELVRPAEEGDTERLGNLVLLITQVDYLNTGKGESFHHKLIHSLGQRLGELGCNMLFKPVYKSEDFSELIRGISPRGIIFDSYNQNDYYSKIVRSGLPSISFNRYTPLMTSVVSDNFGGAYEVVKRLFDAGHRRIAFILGKQSYYSCEERLRGVRQLYAEQGMKFDEARVFEGDWLFGSGLEAASRILGMEKAERPTAVFAFNDDMAYGCYSALLRHGLRVPDDISIAGFDKSNRFSQMFPPITTVDVDLNAIVDCACWYLAESIAGKAPKTSLKIQIDTRISDNGTIKILE